MLLFHTVIQGLRILPSFLPWRWRLQGHYRKVKRERMEDPMAYFVGLVWQWQTSLPLIFQCPELSHIPPLPHVTAGSLKISSVPKRKTQSLSDTALTMPPQPKTKVVLGYLISTSLIQTLIWYKWFHEKDSLHPSRNSRLKFYSVHANPICDLGQDDEQEWPGSAGPNGIPSGREGTTSVNCIGYTSTQSCEAPYTHLKGLSPQWDRVVPLQSLVSVKKWPSEDDIASGPTKATMIPIGWRFSGREGTGQKPGTKLAPGLLRVAQMKKKLTMCTCQQSRCANFLANISKAF